MLLYFSLNQSEGKSNEQQRSTAGLGIINEQYILPISKHRLEMALLEAHSGLADYWGKSRCKPY
jgi:hypothetical protein